MRYSWLVTLCCFALGSCQGINPRTASSAAPAHPVSIPQDELLRHVRILASNDYLGREPGTPGEDLAIGYIEQEFRKASLAPQVSGTYFQGVPVEQRSASGALTIGGRSKKLTLSPDSDFNVQILSDGLKIEKAPIVFAGYGIVAPEFGRDDYANLDVHNKVVVVLAGEPDEMFDPARVRIGADAAEALGKAKRTYQRWDWVKQHNALVKGAKGIVIVVDDRRLLNKRQYFQQNYMIPADSPSWAPPLSIMLSRSAFDRIAEAAETSAADLQLTARSPAFRPKLLQLSVTGNFKATKHTFNSHNVVGRIPGRGKGCVVMTAHWDGYGIDRSMAGDNIWNGAVDDAGGVAQLIEIARQLAIAPPPKRTIVFVATTGEERGFLGARHFLAHTPCPDGEIAAVINLDWFWELGRTRDFATHGLGYSSLDQVVQRLATAQGRGTTAINAYFGGGDQLPFLFAGIPGLHGGSWGTLIDRPKDFEDNYGAMMSNGAILREGNSNRDEVREEWDISGAVQDAELLGEMALELANTARVPCWTAESQFAIRARLCR